jgi:hypothetical protein
MSKENLIKSEEISNLKPEFNSLSFYVSDEIKEQINQKLNYMLRIITESIVYVKDNLKSMPEYGYLFSKTIVHCSNIKILVKDSKSLYNTQQLQNNLADHNLYLYNHKIKGNIVYDINMVEKVNLTLTSTPTSIEKDVKLTSTSIEKEINVEHKFVSTNPIYNSTYGVIPYRFGTLSSLRCKIWFIIKNNQTYNNSEINKLIIYVKESNNIVEHVIKIKEDVYEFEEIMSSLRTSLQNINISLYDEEKEIILDSSLPFLILQTPLSNLLGIVSISFDLSQKFEIKNLYPSIIPLDKEGKELDNGFNYQFSSLLSDKINDFDNKKSVNDFDNKKSVNDFDNKKSVNDFDNKKSVNDFDNQKSVNDSDNKKKSTIIAKIPINKSYFIITNEMLKISFKNCPLIYSINIKIYDEELKPINVLYNIFLSIISENMNALSEIKTHFYEEHDQEISSLDVIKNAYDCDYCPHCKLTCNIL